MFEIKNKLIFMEIPLILIIFIKCIHILWDKKGIKKFFKEFNVIYRFKTVYTVLKIILSIVMQ